MTYKIIYVNNLCERRDNIQHFTDFFKLVKFAAYTAAVYFAVKYALPVIMPFIFGLSIAALVQKPAALLSSRIPRLSKRLCCVIMTASIMLIAAMLIFFALCSIFSGAMEFCPSIPEYLAQAEDFVNRAADIGNSDKNNAWGRFISFAATALDWCIDFLSENYKQYLPSVLSRSTKLFSGLPSFLTVAVFGVISAFFACGSFEKIIGTIRSYLPPKVDSAVSFITKTTVRTITCLLKTYGTLMLITFCELTLGFIIMHLLGCGVGNIITAALVISFIDILPILGTGTVLIPWGLFEFITGNEMQGIMLLIIFAVIGIIRNFLEPKFMGSNLELHPFFTLASIYIGGKLFGGTGMIILPLSLIVMRDAFDKKKNAAE